MENIDVGEVMKNCHCRGKFINKNLKLVLQLTFNKHVQNHLVHSKSIILKTKYEYWTVNTKVVYKLNCMMEAILLASQSILSMLLSNYNRYEN